MADAEGSVDRHPLYAQLEAGGELHEVGALEMQYGMILGVTLTHPAVNPVQTYTRLGEPT